MVKLSKEENGDNPQWLLFPWSTYHATLLFWNGRWWYGYQKPSHDAATWVGHCATRQAAVDAALTLIPKPEGWDASVDAAEAAEGLQ